MSEPRLTVLVAARDEVTRIGRTVTVLREAFPEAEIVVADDGSRDATASAAVAAGARVVRLSRRGKGQALTLAEVANLLKMPGRQVAKPEEANSKSQPDAPELTPVQIEEKINNDRAAWDKRADALQQTAIKAIAAAKAHDKDAVLNVGEEIDNACESCHKVYWYPDEKIPSVPASGAPASKS